MFTEKTRSLRVALISGLAGGATLAGEVLGARLLRPVVGSTAVAQAGAVAGVLGGLGVGALVAARWIEAKRFRPTRLLDAPLALLGLLAVVGPVLARFLSSATARVLVALAARSPGAADVLRALLALALSLPIGLLSGAVYPALVTLHGRGAGRATAVSGAASSAGSAITALLVTFVLAPAFGVRASMVACAAMYATALMLAQSFSSGDELAPDAAPDEPAPAVPARIAPPPRKRRRGARAAPAESTGAKPANVTTRAAASAPSADLAGAKLAAPSARTTLAVMAVVGAASILWQLAMSRLGVLAFGPSAFALAAAGAAHVSALGLGEALCAPRIDRARAPRAVLALALGLAAFGAVVCTALAAHLPAWSTRLYPSAGPSMGTIWLGAYGLLLALMLPVITAVGAAIPLGARLLADAGHTRARANAGALGAMAVGNVVGALLGPLVLIPRAQLRGALLAVALLFALAALVTAGRGAWRVGGPRWKLALAAALFAYGVARAPSQWSAASLLRGPFLYTGAEDLDLGQIVSVRDGREATVAVRRDESGTVLLQIDGKIDATSSGDAATQLMVGLAPCVLARAPREVLVIGLGSGMTVDAVRDVPGVDRVDVTELLPEVIAAARGEFRAANHDVLGAANVRTLAQDASLYLRGSRASYDVIVSQPSNPWVAGMADLFTLDALRAARERLRPGGVMAAWFHAHSTDAPTFASIVATFREVFPRAALVELSAGQDYMILGFVEPVAVDVDRAVAALAAPALAPHLARAGIADRGAFFGRFVAGTDGVAAIAREGELLAADDLRLEFRAPLLLYNDASGEIFTLLARAQDLPLAGLGATGQSYAAVLDESEPAREAVLHGRQMAQARAAREFDRAIFEGEQAVAATPGDRELSNTLARVYLRRAAYRYRHRDPGGTEQDLRTALELHPGPTEQFRAHLLLGDIALVREQWTDTAREYGAALEIARLAQAPAPELHVRMANVLRRLGDLPHARAELDRALRECTDDSRAQQIAYLRNALGN